MHSPFKHCRADAYVRVSIASLRHIRKLRGNGGVHRPSHLASAAHARNHARNGIDHRVDRRAAARLSSTALFALKKRMLPHPSPCSPLAVLYRSRNPMR